MMNRANLKSALLAGAFLCAPGPMFAAQISAANTPPDTATGNAPAIDIIPAAACLNDLRAFDTSMDKDGFWPGGAGFGCGYQMDGYPSLSPTGYRNIRPSYELRILMSSANILAKRGQQQPCEDVLSTARDVYKVYVSSLHSGGIPVIDIPSRQQQDIAAARPVTSSTAPMRSDELLGMDVRNSRDEAIGSVHDIVMSPTTGVIAYLVIGRGGFFGLDEKYVPVPWADFKETAKMSLLVLDTTKRAMNDAPQVSGDDNGSKQSAEESKKVDAYWKTHLSDN